MHENKPLFQRDGHPIMTFRVYDCWGNCISEFTGTLAEWQDEVAIQLPAKAVRAAREHLTVVK